MWRERRKFEEHQQKIIQDKAAVIIAAYARGYLARRKYRKHFREQCGPIVAKTLPSFQKRSWLREAAARIEAGDPSMMPNEPIKVKAPPVAKPIATGIESFLHEWRCKAYRDKCSQEQQAIFREKHIASQLFKGKKKSYPASVGVHFQGDTVGLTSEEIAPKWEKQVVSLTGMGGPNDVLVAVQVEKINRSDGKPAERIFVVTSQGLIITDVKFRLKYRIMFEDIKGLSASSHGDNVFVVHVALSTSKGTKKGDHMFVSPSLVEICTRTYTAYLKHTGKTLRIALQDEIDLQLALKEGRVSFQANEELGEGQAVTRKRANLTVAIPAAVIAAPGSAGKRDRGGSIRPGHTRIVNDGLTSPDKSVAFRASDGALITPAAMRKTSSTSSLPPNGARGDSNDDPPLRTQSASGTARGSAKTSASPDLMTMTEESHPEAAEVGGGGGGARKKSGRGRGGRGGRSGRGRGRGGGAAADASVAAAAPAAGTLPAKPSTRGRGAGRGGGRGASAAATATAPSAALTSSPTGGASSGSGVTSPSGRGGRSSGRGRRGRGRGRGRGRSSGRGAAVSPPQSSTMSV